MIADGGTQLGHSATIARSNTLNGTWESSLYNTLVSNTGTDEYSQTVGHADLFQDAGGNWWGVALTTRGGPRLYNESVFPMGRENALFPVSWPELGWPVAQQVRGQINGPLPQGVKSELPQAQGPMVGKADVVDFKPGSTIPNN
jgi:beta-xylosidase